MMGFKCFWIGCRSVNSEYLVQDSRTTGQQDNKQPRWEQAAINVHVSDRARPVTAELALLFGRALGQSSQYWLNLQAAYDLRAAEGSMGKRLKAVAELAHA